MEPERVAWQLAGLPYLFTLEIVNLNYLDLNYLDPREHGRERTDRFTRIRYGERIGMIKSSSDDQYLSDGIPVS